MRTPIEHSSFGYWIRGDGWVIPMRALQDHGRWIIEQGLYGAAMVDPADPTEAAERAVLDGWIGVSLSPVGSSCGIRIRKGAVTRRAAGALREAIKVAGFLKREVYVDILGHDGLLEHRADAGERIVGFILGSSWDDEVHADPSVEASVLAETVNRLRRAGARVTAGRVALEAGSVPDFARIIERLRSFDDANLRARALAYGWQSAGYDAAGRNEVAVLRRLLDDARSGIRGLAARMEWAIDDARAALYGILQPLPGDGGEEWSPVSALLPGESPSLALARLAEAKNDTMARLTPSDVAFRGAPDNVRKGMISVNIMLAGLTSTPISMISHLRRLDAAEGEAGNDPKKLLRAMLYYLSHECGRTTSDMPIRSSRIASRKVIELLGELGAPAGLPTPDEPGPGGIG